MQTVLIQYTARYFLFWIGAKLKALQSQTTKIESRIMSDSEFNNLKEQLPLAGVKVIEFSHTVMGPTTGMILADLGADVIKVEPLEGDRTRRLSGFAAGFFGAFNRNKRSVSVDLKSAGGRSQIHQLVRSADVIIENFAPGTMDRLGFGWETLKDINPRLIYCQLKGFLPGPYQNRLALDEIVQYMTGLAYMTGLPGRPLRAGASVVDILGGTFGVVAILAALRQREVSGDGQLVRSSLYESAAFLMSQHMAAEVVTGQPSPPMAMRVSAWAIYDTFSTKDEEIVFIGLTTDGIWKRFCSLFNRSDLLSDQTLSSNEKRVENRSRIKLEIQKIVSEYTLEDIVSKCDEHKIPCAALKRPTDLFDDPHLNQSGMLEVQLNEGKMAKLPRLPLTVSGYDTRVRRQPPKCGEHNTELLGAPESCASEGASAYASGSEANNQKIDARNNPSSKERP